MKILVADDEADARAMLRTYLEGVGFQIVEAGDGYDAIDQALVHCPDLIIMDMVMPLMDGINAARAIRQHNLICGTPIVCVTAFGNFYDSLAADAGCTTMLHKPLDLQELELVLTQQLNIV